MMSSSRVKFTSDEVIDRFVANVHVWQTIFEMLSVKDRIRLEMTNKRLRRLMFEYWKRVSSFDAKFLNETSKNSEKLWAAFVAICVDRIGDSLRSLTIHATVPITVTSEILPLIGEGCPNVETMEFLFIGLLPENQAWALPLHAGIYSFSRLIRFDSFPRLKTLRVSTPVKHYSTYASASVFLSIPTSIEVIRGLAGKWEEPFENAAQMEGFFADRPSLRELCLGPLYIRDRSKADIFRVIAQRCPHLKSIKLDCYSEIDYRGVVALDEMKEFRIEYGRVDEMEIVTICERSPLVEALEFRLRSNSNFSRQAAVLNALGKLTKLAHLGFYSHDSYSMSARVVTPSLITDFLRELARNSGASLRRLEIPPEMPLPTAAIEALANGCAQLRDVVFSVRVGEATPASIRFLIDSIVADPSWIHRTGERTLVIEIDVMHDGGGDKEAAMAPFKALAEPAANLPAGVELTIE